MMTRRIKEAAYTMLELLFVVSIISLLLALLIPQLLTHRNKVLEAKAQRSLKAIGSVMSEYALAQHDGTYADFETLKDENLLSKDSTPSSLIVDYSLMVSTIKPGSGKGKTGFTIIAIPRPERSYGRLSTFAITEDNVVRVYKPGPGVSPNDPTTWEPIL